MSLCAFSSAPQIRKPATHILPAAATKLLHAVLAKRKLLTCQRELRLSVQSIIGTTARRHRAPCRRPSPVHQLRHVKRDDAGLLDWCSIGHPSIQTSKSVDVQYLYSPRHAARSGSGSTSPHRHRLLPQRWWRAALGVQSPTACDVSSPCRSTHPFPTAKRGERIFRCNGNKECLVARRDSCVRSHVRRLRALARTGRRLSRQLG
jgi:hypothetical protein